jgi:hypothetical protein
MKTLFTALTAAVVLGSVAAPAFARPFHHHMVCTFHHHHRVCFRR